MRWRNLVATVCLLLTPGCATAGSTLQEFADEVQSIVSNGDVERFRDLPCYPAECIDDDDVEYIFGEAQRESYIRMLLSKPTTKTKLFGPYTYSDELPSSSFVIMYYDPGIVSFNAQGRLSQEQREAHWWNGYVETVVSPLDGGGWGFHRTPFYHGTEPPWLDDF